MATKTSKRNKKPASKRTKPAPTSAKRSSNAYAYSDRIPMISDVLKTDFGGSATVDELFKKLRTKSGEFDKERRVAATLRYDTRVNGDSSVFVRDGKLVTFRSRKRSSAKRSKSGKSRAKK